MKMHKDHGNLLNYARNIKSTRAVQREDTRNLLHEEEASKRNCRILIYLLVPVGISSLSASLFLNNSRYIETGIASIAGILTYIGFKHDKLTRRFERIENIARTQIKVVDNNIHSSNPKYTLEDI